LKDELGWIPSVTFEQGLDYTVEWYLNNWEWIEQITNGSYQSYYEQMYQER
jgi:dTDP-glucose 4,6-dehydratase